MNDLWLKIKVWTKIILFSAVFLYVLLFIYNNSGQPTEFWFWFGHTHITSVFFLTTSCFFAGVIVTLLVRTTWTTVRQIRALQQRGRAAKLQRDVDEMKAKAAML